jgi:hypothetical protein
MGFVINKINNRQVQPEGFYIKIDGIEFLIYEITISASGKVCLKIQDPVRKEHQVKTLCTLEELITATLPDATFIEH